MAHLSRQASPAFVRSSLCNDRTTRVTAIDAKSSLASTSGRVKLMRHQVPLAAHREKGQSLVELALALPVFLLLLLGAIDLGAVMYGYVAISSAVQAGAEYAARTQTFDQTTIDSVIRGESGGFLTTGNTVVLTPQLQSGNQMHLVVVTATYTFTLPVAIRIPPVAISSVPITVQASAPISVQ